MGLRLYLQLRFPRKPLAKRQCKNESGTTSNSNSNNNNIDHRHRHPGSSGSNSTIIGGSSGATSENVVHSPRQ
jgi:hypothetical protein